MGRALLTTHDVRAIERGATALLPCGTLMQRAGAAAARRIDGMLPDTAAPVLVLCGPGNNGGDGFACAAALRAAGRAAICWAPQESSAGDARAARAAFVAAGGTVTGVLPDGRFQLAVDAMFGIGLARPLAPPYIAPLDWLAAQPLPVVALDVPSGLDADSGAWVGGRAGVHADVTVTFLADKVGLHTLDGCDAAGRVEVEPLGVDAGQPDGVSGRIRLLEAGDLGAIGRPRRRNTHKGSFGDVWIVGGGAGTVGAVLLAARAALRLGAGRVFADCIGAPDLRLDPIQPELMFRTLDDLQQADAIVVGCGLGQEPASAAALERVLQARARVLVADADALNLIARDASLRRAFTATSCVRVITPHPLEAARLLGRDVAAVQADRVASARELAATTGATAVLKGAGSLIADPAGSVWINASGSPALATPGSGDALSGMIGALAAQGDDPLAAVLAAVWLHGAAGDEHGADSGLAAGEIAALAARVLQRQRALNRPA
jgi:ADP-dependent NAD(P)H-hydrate dehydratase / NAD(P)H-hydrate epimerase